MATEGSGHLTGRVTTWLADLRRTVAHWTSSPDHQAGTGRILPPDLGPVSILGVDHLEWYVGNARLTAAWFQRLGFTPIARQGPDTGVQDLDSILLAAGDVRILLTSGLTPNHDATRAVAARGDAIHDVAWSVGDVEVAYGRCVHAGLEPDHLPVTLMGAPEEESMSLIPITTCDEVLHTLVTRPESPTSGGDFAPGFVTTAEPSSGAGPVTRVAGITTVVAPGRLDDVVGQHLRLFDLVEVERAERDGVTVAVLACPDDVSRSEEKPLIAAGALRLVFTSPGERTERNQLDEFLARHGGSGVRTVTLATDDMAGLVADWQRAGVSFLAAPLNTDHDVGDGDHDADDESDAGIGGHDADEPGRGAVVVADYGGVVVRRAVTTPLQPRTPVVVAIEEAPDGVSSSADLACDEEAALAMHRRAFLPIEPLGTWGGGR